MRQALVERRLGPGRATSASAAPPSATTARNTSRIPAEVVVHERPGDARGLGHVRGRDASCTGALGEQHARGLEDLRGAGRRGSGAAGAGAGAAGSAGMRGSLIDIRSNNCWIGRRRRRVPVARRRSSPPVPEVPCPQRPGGPSPLPVAARAPGRLRAAARRRRRRRRRSSSLAGPAPAGAAGRLAISPAPGTPGRLAADPDQHPRHRARAHRLGAGRRRHERRAPRPPAPLLGPARRELRPRRSRSPRASASRVRVRVRGPRAGALAVHRRPPRRDAAGAQHHRHAAGQAPALRHRAGPRAAAHHRAPRPRRAAGRDLPHAAALAGRASRQHDNAVTISPVGPGGPMIVDGRGRASSGSSSSRRPTSRRTCASSATAGAHGAHLVAGPGHARPRSAWARA